MSKKSSLVRILAEVGVREGHEASVQKDLVSYMGCFVDASGLFLLQSDCTLAQAEQLLERLGPDEVILVLPAYYRHEVRDGHIPMRTVLTQSRWLIAADGIWYQPLSRSPDLYQPSLPPAHCEREGKVFPGMWQRDLESRLAAIRERQTSSRKKLAAVPQVRELATVAN